MKMRYCASTTSVIDTSADGDVVGVIVGGAAFGAEAEAEAEAEVEASGDMKSGGKVGAAPPGRLMERRGASPDAAEAASASVEMARDVVQAGSTMTPSTAGC
jgi:hypothetical protein